MNDGHNPDRMAEAAREASRRAEQGRSDPEPSLGARLGQIGVLGWTMIVPTLIGVLVGRWLDRSFHTGVFFSAPLLMLGAALGFWFSWRWMHRHL
ncbi:MAG: AtpZ/AtpI family protein [Novosphingobium sp.]|nr:AtpZ/AtpI family protein [Novosphingobium sp.]